MFSRSNFVQTSASALRSTGRSTSTFRTLFGFIQQKVRIMATGTPSASAQAQQNADATSATLSSYDIKNKPINEAPGVKLSESQKVVVGSILDLFSGNPTLKHLSLWHRDAIFADNITSAAGYDKFAAQWYGLPAVFSPIHIQSHKVTSAGNPIVMDLSNKYVVKGLKTEKIMDSVVKIHIDGDGKIEKVEDKWNGNLPEGGVAEAFRKLNAVTVPTMVQVPKTEEEDLKMKAEREKSS
ncbi:uncharacterized protein BCR38DRAFT_452132 [Pseudomassariella vexata]|uniref:SnoaL-like domain-containing protein n=1 Tax=Pseudomassariella vexata TaxID=1141098 RepID=A0A1Y2DAJ7_9PEZI|nr:uncharacterized protein BCR38DRAFT_452132 [Pseudomassariella vexata]ORY55685.1 hypothetical protein BCR38DRAFT_452132 [Pseudomassariella vexata]